MNLRRGEEKRIETQVRANFNNGDFQTVINEFAEYVLLEMIIESEKGGRKISANGGGEERHGSEGWMKRSRMVITHPTSSSDEVNVARNRGRVGGEGEDIPLCGPTVDLGFVHWASYIQGLAICICIGICQCGYNSIVNTTSDGNREGAAASIVADISLK